MAEQISEVETPRQRFTRWHRHLQEVQQGYQRLDTRLAMTVAGETLELWGQVEKAEAALLHMGAQAKAAVEQARVAAVRECVAEVGKCWNDESGSDTPDRVVDKLLALIGEGSYAPKERQEVMAADVGQLRVNADGSIAVGW